MNQVDTMKPTPNRMFDQVGMGGQPGMPTPSPMMGPPQPPAMDFNLDAISPQQSVILTQVASQAKTRMSQDQAYAAASQGIDPNELHQMTTQKRMAEEAAKLAEASVGMAQGEFDELLNRITEFGSQRPGRPAEPELQAPNLWQAGASILAGFIDPSRRAEYASIPLGYQVNKQKQDYAKSQTDYKNQLDDHDYKMNLMETVARYKGQRLQMLEKAAQDARNSADKEQQKLIGYAQQAEKRLDKASSAELGGILKQANQFYEAAGMKGLIVSDAEIAAQVEAKKEEETQAGEQKAWDKEYPSIVRNLNALGTGTPASRKTAAELLHAAVERWPSKFTPDAILRISDALKGAGDPTTKETLDESRTKEADSRTAVNKIKAKYLPQQFQDNHDKARKTIQNMQSVIDHRKATGEGNDTSSEERIAANQALQSIDRAMDDYRLVAQNARERLNKINDYIVGDPKLADQFKDEKAELEDTIREAQAGFEQMQKESKEVRDYLKSKTTAKEEGWLDKAGNAVRGFIGMSGAKRKPSKKGEIPPMGVAIPKDMKAKGWK